MAVVCVPGNTTCGKDETSLVAHNLNIKKKKGYFKCSQINISETNIFNIRETNFIG